MLQQTTVGAVLHRYDSFLRRFPDLGCLARAREESVLAAWSGLGYYARARNLWRAARQISREHGGEIPRDPDALRRLPGFGEYMAAAVCSLAFGMRVPATDSNITRVLSRLFAIGGVSGSGKHRTALRSRIEVLLPRNRPGEVTAALMDLGQLVCTPRRPNCPACPLARECQAYRRGEPERFPERRPKPRPQPVYLAAGYAESRGRALLVRRRGGWLSGLWEFPAAEAESRQVARRHLSERLRQLALSLGPGEALAAARHSIMNRRIQIEVFAARVDSTAQWKRQEEGGRWFRRQDLSRAAIPTLTRKIAVACGFLPA